MNAFAYRRVALAVILTLVTSVRAHGGAFELGGRAGFADLSDDVFEGAHDLGSMHLLGGQVLLGLGARLSIEVAGEVTSEEIEFRDEGLAGEIFEGKAEWEDRAIYTSLRLHLLPIALGAATLYAGGGGGVHFTEANVIDPVPVGRSGEGTQEGARASGGDPTQDWIDDLEGEKEQVEWHLLGGVSLRPQAVPFTFFGEVRYQDVTEKQGPSGYALYAGLNLRLR